MNNTKTIKRHIHRGFTLIEIIVVVTIIAVIATLIVPKLLTHVGDAKQSAAQSNLSTIDQQVIVYLLAKGLSSIPNDFELELLTLSEDDGGASGGPYLKKGEIIDPWGNPFEILIPGDDGADYTLVSWGELGEPGGEGAQADIFE
jgi:general secretion pathway protein G